MFFTSNLLTNLLGVSVALIAIIIAYFKWTYKYWERKGVDTLEPTIPFGNAADIFFGKKTFGNIWQSSYNYFRQKGLPYGGGYFFAKKFFIPTDPELIKSILQKDFQHFVNHGGYIDEKIDPLSGHLFALEDSKWKSLRSKLTPTFTSGKMKMMFDTLTACADGLSIALQKPAIKNEAVDIKEVLGCFSTDIIGSVAFGIECNSLENPNSDFRKHGKLVFENNFKESLINLLQFILPRKLLSMINFKLTKPQVEEFFMNMVRKTVDYREKNNVYRKDFMHLLLQLKNMGKITDDEKFQESHNVGEAGLSMNELAAQAFVFFIAGFETSSTTMTFALYEIALNQDIQKKMREEINAVMKKHDDKLTYDAIMEMHYLDKVIHETLRKYPPATVLVRACNKDYQVPDSNVIIEEGTIVAISVAGIHMDNEYYPNPSVFDPERFNEENKQTRPAYTWLPFGEGPRICIGLRFGLMQTKVGLATILRNYEISLSRKTSIPLVYDNKSVVLSAAEGIWLDIKKI